MSQHKNANNHVGTMHIDLCRIYGHEWETLALGEIVCYRCGAVHKQHIWQDRSEGGAIRMTDTGPADSVHEKVICVICKMDKADFDRTHTTTISQSQEIP
jgi:hypothetical protein